MIPLAKPCRSCLKPTVFLRGAFSYIFVDADTWSTKDGDTYDPDKHTAHCKTCTGKPPEKERRK